MMPSIEYVCHLGTRISIICETSVSGFFANVHMFPFTNRKSSLARGVTFIFSVGDCSRLILPSYVIVVPMSEPDRSFATFKGRTGRVCEYVHETPDVDLTDCWVVVRLPRHCDGHCCA